MWQVADKFGCQVKSGFVSKVRYSFFVKIKQILLGIIFLILHLGFEKYDM